MDFPWITIVIPTYKRPALLKKAIMSALNQTKKELIVLVLDNASGDETGSVVNEFCQKDLRVQYICHNENIGMLQNYQHGLNAVATDYFSFLSDDDLLMPNFCEIAFEGVSKYPEAAFFASSTIFFSQETGISCVDSISPLQHWPREGIYFPPFGLYEMIARYPVPTTVVFKRDTLSAVSIDFKNPIRWDCDFLFQLAGRFPIAISKQICGFYLNHPGSFSINCERSTCDSILRMIERVESFDFLTNKSRKKTVKLLQMEHLRVLFLCCLDLKKLSGLHKRIVLSIFKAPFSKFSVLMLLSLIPYLRRGLKIWKKNRDFRRKRKHSLHAYNELFKSVPQ
jgi:glycosyltransferase involved in cell wall biosynthesis